MTIKEDAPSSFKKPRLSDLGICDVTDVSDSSAVEISIKEESPPLLSRTEMWELGIADASSRKSSIDFGHQVEIPVQQEDARELKIKELEENALAYNSERAFICERITELEDEWDSDGDGNRDESPSMGATGIGLSSRLAHPNFGGGNGSINSCTRPPFSSPDSTSNAPSGGTGSGLARASVGTESPTLQHWIKSHRDESRVSRGSNSMDGVAKGRKKYLEKSAQILHLLVLKIIGAPSNGSNGKSNQMILQSIQTLSPLRTSYCKNQCSLEQEMLPSTLLSVAIQSSAIFN